MVRRCVVSELIETLRDALDFAVSYHTDVSRVDPPNGWSNALSLLSDRRALLSHLLKAEGLPGVEEIRICQERDREMRDLVEIREDKYSNYWVNVGGILYLVHYAYGRIFTTINADDITDPCSEDYDRLSLAFAALAEKRRREGEVSDG